MAALKLVAKAGAELVLLYATARTNAGAGSQGDFAETSKTKVDRGIDQSVIRAGAGVLECRLIGQPPPQPAA